MTLNFGLREDSSELFNIYCLVSNRYPGGPLLNPLGLAKDAESAKEWKLKEIKNGLLFYNSTFLPQLRLVC